MIYFEMYPGDYLKDTTRLSLTDHGVYFKLMLAYYSEEQALPESLADRRRNYCGGQGCGQEGRRTLLPRSRRRAAAQQALRRANRQGARPYCRGPRPPRCPKEQ